ncbi:hypothetical protein GC163_04945 [bacterium]|nr:hypothetical protein [bacterium]
MSYVSLAIYGTAAVWAVQMLLTLMEQHRRRKLAELQQAEIVRLQAEAVAAAEAELEKATAATPLNRPPLVAAKSK